jgi:hypothetical protein
MSFKLVDEILAERFQSGCGNEKLILLILAKHADDKKRTSWPSVETLEDLSSLSRRTVQRSLRNLERIGYISDVTHYYANDSRKRDSKYGGLGKSTHYQIAAKERRLECAIEELGRMETASL